MSDFAKTIVAVLVTTAMSSIATIASLSSSMASIDKGMVRIEKRMDKYGDRVREIELAQARYLASN